jgi:hypothetical protein
MVKATRDTLLGNYHNNPKKLAEWGYEVTEAPASTTKKTASK